jgi:hypothetical protein
LERAGIRMRVTPRAIVRHTFGERVGLKAMYGLSRSYAVGHGALAGKMTLAGDPRGPERLRLYFGDFVRTLRPKQLHRAPKALMRYWYVHRAYHECTRTCEYDSEKHVLRRRASA